MFCVSPDLGFPIYAYRRVFTGGGGTVHVRRRGGELGSNNRRRGMLL